MQQPIPYLAFRDQAATALAFYQRLLGGRLEVMTFGEGPGGADLPPETQRLTLHAALTDGPATLMASDVPPDRPFERLQGFSLGLHYPDLAEAERIFAALGDGGAVVMPLAETFWAERFGMVTDRFGVSWFVNGGAMKQG